MDVESSEVNFVMSLTEHCYFFLSALILKAKDGPIDEAFIKDDVSF